MPQIVRCVSTTGPADYILDVLIADIKAYEQFQHDTLFRLPGVTHVRSSIVLKEVKHDTRLPVPTGAACMRRRASGAEQPRSLVDSDSCTRGVQFAAPLTGGAQFGRGEEEALTRQAPLAKQRVAHRQAALRASPRIASADGNRGHQQRLHLRAGMSRPGRLHCVRLVRQGWWRG